MLYMAINCNVKRLINPDIISPNDFCLRACFYNEFYITFVCIPLTPTPPKVAENIMSLE